MKNNLLISIKNKEAKIGIFGLGYVGLPLALRFSETGFRVTGFDIDAKKVEKLIKGESYIDYIGSESIKRALNDGFCPTTDISIVRNLDAIIICVPTPLNKHREPDLSFIKNTIDSIIPFLREFQCISLESTTYPGTTEEEILPKIETRGFKVGEDFFLVYSPEREDPGNPSFSTKNIPKIVGGHTPVCLDIGKALYEGAIDSVVTVSSTKAAEMTKLLENIHRSVNIGLVNEMKIISDKMGMDIHEIIRAASTKPFGFTPYYPGPGLGGHCIPIDPFYLTWKAREFGVYSRFIELAGEVNSNMPNWILNKSIDALNEKGKAIKGSKVLLLGIAYKKNVDDMRESPAVELLKLFSEKGGILSYSDPLIPIFPQIRKYAFQLESIQLTPESLKDFDIVIIATDHDKFDYEMIKNYSELIIDTRGVYKEDAPNVVRA